MHPGELQLWIRIGVGLCSGVLFGILWLAQTRDGRLIRLFTLDRFCEAMALWWYIWIGVIRLYGIAPREVATTMASDWASLVWLPFLLTQLALVGYFLRLMRRGTCD